jgi:DNA-directed RNA polymerase specialized sigma24 family protein
MEDRSYAEIAEEQGVPLGTVKSRLFRCMSAIQQALRPAASP